MYASHNGRGNDKCMIDGVDYGLANHSKQSILTLDFRALKFECILLS